MCSPSTKSEKTDDVGVCECVPIVHIIEEDVAVTTGLLVGSIGATGAATGEGGAAANGEKLVVTPQTCPFT
jgi:hypothetical protein